MSQGHILAINGGSSSIKFAVYTSDDSPRQILAGRVERIGSAGARLVANGDDRPIGAASAPAKSVADYLRERLGVGAIAAVGHRIVHGGINLLDHQLITPAVIAELRRIEPIDLPHLPIEIALIEAFEEVFASQPHVACFDTAFHRDMPRVAQLLPIPRQFLDAGVRRFGFHGLSFTYLMGKLGELAPEAVRGRVILAHLGAGASMAAVRGGQSIDTTMAFTPIAGLVMATRCGDLDPGLLVYLMREQKMSVDQADDFISHQCGLLGVSQTSSDMRDLLARRGADPRAAEAVDLFCYQARKHVGALAAALGGLDALVFSGGIGEHSPEVRQGICTRLDFLGVAIDPSANLNGSDVISTKQSRVVVRIIPTDEQIVIAQTVRSVLKHAAPA